MQNLLHHLARFTLSSEDGAAVDEVRAVLPTAVAWKRYSLISLLSFQ